MSTNSEEQQQQQRSTTVKTTTTYETRSAYDADGSGLGYRAGVTPRSVIIQRSSYGGMGMGGGGGGRSGYSKERSVQYGMTGISPGSYAMLTSTGVTDVKVSREKEKKDMQDLNERFASYIEKVRFLEAQNRRLADELEKLKSKWGKETTQIKAMYQAELDEARRLLDDAEKEKARLEIRVASMEEVLQELRQRLEEANKTVLENRELLERQNQQISDYESEIGLLRRRMELMETDRDKDKKLIAQLQEALNRARADLDNETLLHVDAENRRQTLEEEIEFLKTVHEQELKELAALAYRDTTAENRDFWKNEMGQALREIQQVYDDKMDLMRHEMETSYNFKLQEFRTGATKQNMETTHSKDESKRLRTQLTDLRDKLNDLDAKNAQLMRELEQLRRDKEDREKELEQENNELKEDVAKLRAEMEAILRELQNIMDAKLGLELEIAAYRKLLEGEESRIGLKQVVDMWNTNSMAGGSGFGGGSGGGSGFGGGSGGGSGFGGGAGFGGGSGYGYGGGESSSSAMMSSRGEMSAKTTYQRSAKGPIAIAECSQDGKFITLENTGRKEESISGWKLSRNVDGEDKLNYVFPDPTTFGPGSKMRIWSKENKPQDAPGSDLEVDVATFGIGANITTKLFNTAGEDRTTHVQKTVYA